MIKARIAPEEMDRVDAAVERFNHGSALDAALAVSKGASRFRPDADTRFKEVFARADERMYADKKAYYEATGDRRGSPRRYARQ